MTTLIPRADAFREGPTPDALRSAGFERTAAARILHAFAACRATLGDGTVGFFVPGRIEILGKHTDYAGGRSLVSAVDRGFTLVATPRADRVVRVLEAEGDAVAELTLDAALPPMPGDWSDYARTVVRRLVRDHGLTVGTDIAFMSDVPRAAGVSSSSALVIGILLALAAVNDLVLDEADSAAALATYASAIENGRPFGSTGPDGGVGTLGGSQDHTAILCCEPNAASRFAWAPVRPEGTVALPAGCTFVVAASGVRAAKTGDALESYNRLSALAAQAADVWRAETGRTEQDLGAILDGGHAGILLEMLRSSSLAGADVLHRRVEQFVEETGTHVPGAFAALEAGDLHRFGTIVARSQRLAETHLDNQIEETVDLVRLAIDRGAHAASAFGAGFGGSVWALVPSRGATAFAMEWLEAYRSLHPDRVDASAFVTPAGPPATRLL